MGLHFDQKSLLRCPFFGQADNEDILKQRAIYRSSHPKKSPRAFGVRFFLAASPNMIEL